MNLRNLTAADRPLLREATLANMNWNGPRFGFADIDAAPELSHHFTGLPGDGDFRGIRHDSAGVVGSPWKISTSVMGRWVAGALDSTIARDQPR